MKLSQELKLRGIIKQTTSDEVFTLLDKTPIRFYCGFDPTADSLHVGSLLPLITMKRLKEKGHNPIVIAGGATALIGDPSFKKDERGMLTPETVTNNLKGITPQIKNILGDTLLLNNFDWFKEITILDFLRNQGKCFTINSMISKESVKERIEDPKRGISFTEFTYIILQSEDFSYLFKNHNCILQIGGSDQWSNILGGIDLIRKHHGKEAFGLTIPLLVKSNGQKFGKTESGNVWLDKNKTSVFDFFQFFLKTDEREVVDLLKKLTFLSLDEIKTLEESNLTHPKERLAQKALAREITRLVHGEEGVKEAEQKTAALFGNGELLTPDLELYKSQELEIIDLLVQTNLSTSKTMARKDMASGAIRINNEKVLENRKLSLTEKSHDLVLSKGKAHKKLLRFVSN